MSPAGWIHGDVDTSGALSWFQAVCEELVGQTKSTRIEEPATLPVRFEVSQNYPNPFNPTTTIEFSLATPEEVTIEVLNVLGQTVKTLTDRRFGAGDYSIEWNGTNSDGEPVSTGVYFYRISAGEFVDTKKMTLIR